MTRREFITSSAAAVAAVLVTGGPAWANKAEAGLVVPASAAKGAEIPVQITVSHSANSLFHHVEWAWVQVNGNEIARWDFTGSNLPESETFSRTVHVKMAGNLEIRAKASCNLHGSADEAVATIKML